MYELVALDIFWNLSCQPPRINIQKCQSENTAGTFLEGSQQASGRVDDTSKKKLSLVLMCKHCAFCWGVNASSPASQDLPRCHPPA